MCTREPRLVLVSLLIGWKNGARTLNQSLCEVIINQSNLLIYFRHSIEKHSIVIISKLLQIFVFCVAMTWNYSDDNALKCFLQMWIFHSLILGQSRSNNSSHRILPPYCNTWTRWINLEIRTIVKSYNLTWRFQSLIGLQSLNVRFKC